MATIYISQTLNQLNDKTKQTHHCLAFVNYEKVFEWLEDVAVFNSIQEQGISENYKKLLRI